MRTMELLCNDGKLSCFHFQKEGNLLIYKIEGNQEEYFNMQPVAHTVVWLEKGRILASWGTNLDVMINKGEFFLLPSQSQFSCKVEKDTSIVLLSLPLNSEFCDQISIEVLFGITQSIKKMNAIKILNANERLNDFLKNMAGILSDGLCCNHFMSLKIKEFLFILGAYYSKLDLFSFFAPILTNDMHFSYKVYNYYDQTKTAGELAEKLNYSLSGFKKKFKKVFGIPVYQWMRKEKAKNIYHAIHCSKKTFSEIGFEFGFTSTPHFNDFCKTHFGFTPGEIRKNKENDKE